MVITVSGERKWMSAIILCIILVRKGSFSVPSEMCDSVNRESLQSEAIKVALEQNMLCNSDMSSTKIYVTPHGRVINFARERYIRRLDGAIIIFLA